MNRLVASGGSLSFDAGTNQVRCDATAIRLATCCVLFYFGSYLSKYPMFLLPWAGTTWGIENKVWISAWQTLGYASAKIPAMKYGSEMPRHRRFCALLFMYIAQALFMTAFIPFLPPVACAGAAFCGGLSGSWMWGILMQYLEGRQITDVLLASLNGIVIFGPAAARALGEYVRASVVGANNALWMPVVIATAYAPVAILALLVLNGAAPPTPEYISTSPARQHVCACVHLLSCQHSHFLHRRRDLCVCVCWDTVTSVAPWGHFTRRLACG
eukprot:m.156299 g.156299  ORF g.156299 m.156299 type:complete len:271 (-) comp17936_c1_seq70:2451-3263(-)